MQQNLSPEEITAINSEVQTRGKSMLVAYLLLIVLWGFGIHRLYLDDKRGGFTMLGLAIAGWATSWILIGFIFLAIVWVWNVIDLFTTYGKVNTINNAIREEATARIVANRKLEY